MLISGHFVLVKLATKVTCKIPNDKSQITISFPVRKRVSVIGYWDLRFICYLVLVICNLPAYTTSVSYSIKLAAFQARGCAEPRTFERAPYFDFYCIIFFVLQPAAQQQPLRHRPRELFYPGCRPPLLAGGKPSHCGAQIQFRFL